MRMTVSKRSTTEELQKTWIIAKEYLDIQASSAKDDIMFSISGQIFSLKIRRLGEAIFSGLVYLKLNESKL